MRRRTIKKYTAFVPRSFKATKNVGKKALKEINYFLRTTKKTLKRTSKMLNVTAAKSIRSLTKRRARR
jgi:hypothetical protein